MIYEVVTYLVLVCCTPVRSTRPGQVQQQGFAHRRHLSADVVEVGKCLRLALVPRHGLQLQALGWFVQQPLRFEAQSAARRSVYQYNITHWAFVFVSI